MICESCKIFIANGVCTAYSEAGMKHWDKLGFCTVGNVGLEKTEEQRKTRVGQQKSIKIKKKK